MNTSFGEMEILTRVEGKPQVEYLKFVREGRSHRHADYESFFVLKGHGQVFVDAKVFEVQPGSQIVIPPNAPHWMKPAEGSVLEGLLWYHDAPVSLLS